jgi:VanZ family protein
MAGLLQPLTPSRYGCSDISRHDLQRLCYNVTEDLFAWKENLPSNLEIDLDDETTPRLPHLLMLQYVFSYRTTRPMKLIVHSMQYHQIVIFTHRPWVSKNYIQPRSPRQGPGYHHARRMCIESSTAIARILHIYEKHYTFRRMNNQVVAIIFSAALMLLYVTIANTFSSSKNSSENTNSNAEMVAYLNLCFRALDELGQSFENAKRTRDFLVSLQRRWQAHLRKDKKVRFPLWPLPLWSLPLLSLLPLWSVIALSVLALAETNLYRTYKDGHPIPSPLLPPRQRDVLHRFYQRVKHPYHRRQSQCPGTCHTDMLVSPRLSDWLYQPRLSCNCVHP